MTQTVQRMQKGKARFYWVFREGSEKPSKTLGGWSLPFGTNTERGHKESDRGEVSIDRFLINLQKCLQFLHVQHRNICRSNSIEFLLSFATHIKPLVAVFEISTALHVLVLTLPVV